MNCAVILCLMSGVITAAPIRQLYSRDISRHSRSEPSGDTYDRFIDHHMFLNAHTEHIPYSFDEDSKMADKLRSDAPMYPDMSSFHEMATEPISPYTINPMISADYELSRIAADVKYHATKPTKSDYMIDKLKSMIQYVPSLNEVFSGYDTNSDFHNDDDDIRSSGRTMYDNYWPYFYHSPYEYESTKDASDIEKAIDKRYASTSYEGVIPVHEHIENDVSTATSLYKNEPIGTTDNPIGGNEAFFSFVLNDYFDKNHDEDPVSFKGLQSDWGKDFDNVGYKPLDDQSKMGRRLEDNVYTPIQWLTTVRPKVNFNLNHDTIATAPPRHLYTTTQEYTTSLGHPTSQVYSSPQGYPSSHPTPKAYPASQAESVTDKTHKSNQNFNKYETGENKNANHNLGYDTNVHKYEGFKDFLDGFANKFGSEDHKKDSKYEQRMNKDKGEKRKGFRRIYQKNEFQEDNEFFDNTNNSAKAEEKGSLKAHIGGSEALLRSQAVAALNNAARAAGESGNTGDRMYENSNKGLYDYDSFDNRFHKYIDVAKQAARSNNADYLDRSRV